MKSERLSLLRLKSAAAAHAAAHTCQRFAASRGVGGKQKAHVLMLRGPGLALKQHNQRSGFYMCSVILMLVCAGEMAAMRSSCLQPRVPAQQAHQEQQQGQHSSPSANLSSRS